MKINNKELLILVVPIIIMIVLIPILPEKIPMQWNSKGEVNWYLDKKLSFLLGLLPYILYKLIQVKYFKK